MLLDCYAVLKHDIVSVHKCNCSAYFIENVHVKFKRRIKHSK